jgi:RNA polymerase sigma-70 factor (ECF subfamily)
MEWVKQAIDPRKVEENYEAKELQSELNRLLGCLPEKIRCVIVLKYLHQLKNEEVAAILQIPLGTVKSRCSKGLRLLRRELTHDHTQCVKEGLL